MTAEGLVVVLLSFGRFLIPMILVLALFWYLVRFQVDARDRAALATAGIALGLTLAAQLSVDLLYVDNLALEIGTSFERILLQLWPAALLIFFLASGPLQLGCAEPSREGEQREEGRPVPRAALWKPVERSLRLNWRRSFQMYLRPALPGVHNRPHSGRARTSACSGTGFGVSVWFPLQLRALRRQATPAPDRIGQP